MLQLIRQNRIYYTCLGLYFLIGAAILIVMEKGQLEISMNRRHSIELDYFFRMITYLGDGVFAFPLILLIFLFNNIYKSMVIFISVIATFIFVQTIKGIMNMPRPSTYFSKDLNLHYVDGVDIHALYSFPSGHSAQAFALFLSLALFNKNKTAGGIFFLLAFLTAVSRMYLLQHFLIDTYFGALIATFITSLTYLYFTNYTKLSEKTRWQRGLLF